jgi:hypothetical protein
MRKNINIQTIATGSSHSFGEGFEKPIFEEKKNESNDIFSFIKKPTKKKK